jgi:hypothetical protein
MSISTQGGEQRRPSVVSTGKKPPASGKPAAKSAAKSTPGAKAGAGKSGGPRRPIAPVKVNQGRNWGPIGLFLAVALIAAGIIGYGAWAVFKSNQSWQDKAAAIAGIVNYRKTDPGALTRGHAWGPLTYKVSPPVGGEHNFNWQNCMGNVYDTPIANEHAVHSLEHGAVWITYDPSLPADQVEKLASKVRGQDYTMMSPLENLGSKISLQAWGYELKVDNADDGRIDEFIKALRVNASEEPGATCSQGITATGTTPRDLGKDQQQGK